MPTLTCINIDRHQKITKKNCHHWIQGLRFMYNFKLYQNWRSCYFCSNYGLKDDRCQYWQVPNLTGIKNHKKLLSLLNSTSSICVEYEISSKLKHLPFFVQNYGLKDDRCQHWQVSILRGVKNYKNLLSPLNSPPLIYVEYKIWSKRWQVPALTGVKNHRKLLSSMNSAPSNCSKCKISW